MGEFPMGRLLVTRGVNDRRAEEEPFARFVLDSLNRHAMGDWGDLCVEDRRENERCLNGGCRLFSAYGEDGLPKIWIITETDRSATTVLFPEEY